MTAIASDSLPLTATLAPSDQDAVVEAVCAAYHDGTAVYPIGGGSQLQRGLRPTRPGVGLSLGQLCRVIDHAAHDMTITVEAGISMAELARTLSSARQCLPVDVPQGDRATVGGAVATGTSGPRGYGCGTIRDYVLGLTAVDGRGVKFSGGGRVVKNAAGYNLPRLLVGSLGTLGVVTQVTLMVRPLPEASALVACDVPDLDTAEQFLSRLVHSNTRPVAIELLAGSAAYDVPLGEPIGEGSVARLVVGFEGSQAEVSWMVGELCDEWRTMRVFSPVIVPHAEVAHVWNWLTEFHASVQIHVLPSQVVAMIGRLLAIDPRSAIQAHAGSGVLRVELSHRPPQSMATLIRHELRPAVAAANGNMLLLSCPHGVQWTRDDVWGTPRPGMQVMQAIKERFDPKGLLNPGRFVFED